MLNHFPGHCLDAAGDSFLVEVEPEVMNTFHGRLLVGLTRAIYSTLPLIMSCPPLGGFRF